MNISRVFVWTHVLTSLSIHLRVELLDYTPHSHSMFNLLRNPLTVFQNDCNITHSHQKYMRISISLHLGNISYLRSLALALSLSLSNWSHLY